MRTLIIAVGLLVGPAVFADASSGCDGRVTTFRALASCAEENAPELARLGSERERARGRVAAAGHLTNPQFSVNAVAGMIGPLPSVQTDLAIAVPVQVGQIGARVRAARAEVERLDSEFAQARARLRNEVFVRAVGLNHLRHERDLLNDAILVFARLIERYVKRPQLSPEQDLSLAVFRMAKADYELRQVGVTDEADSAVAYFRGVANADVSDVADLPAAPEVWPDADELIRAAPLKLAQAAAEVDGAREQSTLARAQTWSTLSMGPSAQYQKNGPQAGWMYGVNLSLPLPLFNRNAGGRRVAAAAVHVAEVQKSVVAREDAAQVGEFANVYRNSVRALTSFQSHRDLERAHRGIERRFNEGLVSSALVIEAHRSFIDLERSRHDRQMKALTALASLYTRSGRVFAFGKE